MVEADRADVTVLVDNKSISDTLVTTYGLSLHIRVERGGKAWNILFDVGSSAYALHANAHRLNVMLGDVDHIVISHMHRDHYNALVEAPSLFNPRVVYLPEPRGVSQRVSEVLRELRVEKTVYVHGRLTIAPGVEAFGPVMRSGEISLNVLAGGWRLLLVACGHAGLENILYWSRVKPHVVVGGFHLKSADKGRVEKLADALSETRLVVGLHCSHWRDELLRTLLGTKYIAGGAGLRISLDQSGLQLHPQPSL